jgi:hypothetical protein
MTIGRENLRRELDTVSTLVVKADYIAALDQLRQTYQHSVRILSEGASRMERFNCFAYVLGMWNDPLRQIGG